jgi:uncharacterized protein YfaP (DUF2135 family)
VRLEQLRGRIEKQRWRSKWLLGGIAAALALALLCTGWYYLACVLPYAAIQDIQLALDSHDAEGLTFVFRPTSRGIVGFGRADAGRETELVEHIAPNQVGRPYRFQWRVKGVQADDEVWVTFLDGWRLRKELFRVPDRQGITATGTFRRGRTIGTSGAIFGSVLNALNKQPVAKAQMRVLGESLTTQTDNEGKFRIEHVPAGTLTLEVAAEGFTTETLELSLAAGQEVERRIVLSPGLEKGQLRLVLTWDQPAQDLDAHLQGPLPGGKRFHVYYHNPGDLKSKEFVRLDVDDRSGGPETITVLGLLPGTYRYFVHDYTNRDRPASDALGRSRPEVRVFQGGQTHRFRAKEGMVGNLWDVCAIEVTPDGAVVKKIDEYRGATFGALGLYAKRTLPDRQQWLGGYGGTAQSEQAVLEGLAWLARHQGRNGAWSSQTLSDGADSQCRQQPRCTQPGGLYEMAQTGLALLALQAGGHYYFNKNTYSEVVRRGLDWMVSHQRADGALVGTNTSRGGGTYHQYFMYEHGIAAFALGDACAAAVAMNVAPEPRYLAALQKAIDYIERIQHADGGWRYRESPAEASDTSVSGWPMLAIKSAQEAGLYIKPSTIEGIRRLFEARATGEHGRTGYLSRVPVTEATTGVGMLARQFLLGEPDATLVREAARYLAGYAEERWGDRRVDPENTDYYLWYNCTLAMFHAGGEPWKRWNDIIRETLIKLQRRGGCEKGSWDPSDRWGKLGGRIYSTALAVLTLETYYRYTPQHELDGFGGGQPLVPVRIEQNTPQQ